ncbi:MAG: hypothetical protein AB4372_08160 [Xenococcus sp. (in: cyanobacteria)]
MLRSPLGARSLAAVSAAGSPRLSNRPVETRSFRNRSGKGKRLIGKGFTESIF